jgi:glycosyltransferase involved in cell wall biosynthesis
MQMMLNLSQRMPVLYVNSVGVRIPRPREGRMFLHRIRRKLGSIARGLVRVDRQLWTYSPVAVPGRVGMSASRGILAAQIRRAAHRIGIRRPLLWVTCPPGAEVVDALNPTGVVYQRTDRWECFPDADEPTMRAYHEQLRGRADLVLFCSDVLFSEEGRDCRAAEYIDHGVDFDRFAASGRRLADDPPEIGAIPRPRVGFIGGIDAHTFDPTLFCEVARRMPGIQFVLVGACSLPSGWCDLANVHSMGRRPFEEVDRYMAACDVLIMPWAQNRWIQACNPVKLKEYLAVGRPVVSTPFPQLKRFAGVVSVASTAEAFTDAIARNLSDSGDEEARRRIVQGDTWALKAQMVLDALARTGLRHEA